MCGTLSADDETMASHLVGGPEPPMDDGAGGFSLRIRGTLFPEFRNGTPVQQMIIEAGKIGVYE
jgi:hypothetical protein